MTYYYSNEITVYQYPVSAAVDFCNDLTTLYLNNNSKVWPITPFVIKRFDKDHTFTHLIPFWGFQGLNPDRPYYQVKTLTVDSTCRTALSSTITDGPYSGVVTYSVFLHESDQIYLLTNYVDLSTLISIASDGSDFMPLSALSGTE